MLLETLAASLLGSVLTGKGVIRGGEGTIRASQNFLMLPQLLTNFQIQKYYRNEPKCNGIYSRKIFYKIMDGADYDSCYYTSECHGFQGRTMVSRFNMTRYSSLGGACSGFLATSSGKFSKYDVTAGVQKR